MFKIFKRNKKENKFYRVIKAFDVSIGEDVEINEVWDSVGVNNMVVNGYIFEENDIEEIDRKTYLRELNKK